MDHATKRQRTDGGSDDVPPSLHREGEHMTIAKAQYDEFVDGTQGVTVLYRTVMTSKNIRTKHMLVCVGFI